MTHSKDTFVPNAGTLVASAQRVTAISTFTVTLRNSNRGLLLRSTAPARSPQEAISQAEFTYSAFTAAIAEQRDLRQDSDALVPDAAQTIVFRRRAPEACQIRFLVKLAGDERCDDAAVRLSELEAGALLREVVAADQRMHEILVAGGTIDPCPSHAYSPTTGWITIDCTFRVNDATGRPRAVYPSCPAVRMAVRLIVLRQLLPYPVTNRTQIGQRESVGTVSLPSATLRAALRLQGPARPEKLIAWLGAHGHAAIAAAVAERAGR